MTSSSGECCLSSASSFSLSFETIVALDGALMTSVELRKKVPQSILDCRAIASHTWVAFALDADLLGYACRDEYFVKQIIW